MSKLSPPKSIHKLLISTTSQIKGSYERDWLRVTPAFWPASNFGSAMTESMFSRSAYVVTFEAAPDPKNEHMWQNYDWVGEEICIYLSILYGKRFDNHGIIEGAGICYMPNYSSFQSPANSSIPQNSRVPRRDISISLNLDEIKRIDPLLRLECEERFKLFLLAAGRFYLHALQSVEERPEVAYLDLITAGEIISNYYEFDKNELMDDEVKDIIRRIEEAAKDGPELAKKIKGRLFQVKSRFRRAMEDLLTDPFFANSEAERDSLRLKKEGINKRLAAAYDLRSQYLHTGVSFGYRIYSGCTSPLEEVQFGSSEVPYMGFKNTEFNKILAKAPTYFGLERIIRYCLLRFIHTNNVPIDPKLDDIS